MVVNKKNIIIISTVIVLLITAIIVVVSYNRALMPKKPNNINNSEDTDDDVEEDGEIDTKQKVCVGKYYGEYDTYLDDGQVSLNLKYTYVLNSDNTYSANFISSGNEGTYRIDGDTIIFKHAAETNRSSEVEDKYEIADDCSYIMIDDPDNDIYSFKLNRQ